MALAGAAFLALWNDIRRAREPEYDQWHTLEHVPERVAVDGFLGARRYVNRVRERHRYFTLYDVADLAVFETEAYRDLLDHPTPWSAAMRPDFENFVRAVCAVDASAGTGIGGAVATLCLEAVDDDTLRSALDAAATLPRINAVHLGSRRDGAPSPRVGGANAKEQAPRTFSRIALIEALDHDAAADALVRVQRALDLRAMPRDFGADVYDLALVFPGHDATERNALRRAGWDGS
jgi:hypothetical protein